jgi:hypothetical protein
MVLWTIRVAAEVEILKRRGRLIASNQWIPRGYDQAYRWMANQLSVRVGPPPAGCHYPLWAWYQWAGACRPRPDLRTRAHLPKGQRGVRITFEADPAQILLSDFDGWHAVLNHHYLPKNDSDAAVFEQKLESVGNQCMNEIKLEIEQSWQCIFDLGQSSKNAAKLSIQAVLWELRLAQVREMYFFTAR